MLAKPFALSTLDGQGSITCGQYLDRTLGKFPLICGPHLWLTNGKKKSWNLLTFSKKKSGWDLGQISPNADGVFRVSSWFSPIPLQSFSCSIHFWLFILPRKESLNFWNFFWKFFSYKSIWNSLLNSFGKSQRPIQLKKIYRVCCPAIHIYSATIHKTTLPVYADFNRNSCVNPV